MPETFNSLFTPVNAIHTRTIRLTSSSYKFYQDIVQTKCQKVLYIKGLKLGTQYLMK